MLDWLIIGGGIHGVHLAVRLIGQGCVKPDRLRIIDPADRLLARWRSCTEAVGMTHLRSPAVHHLDLDPNDLRKFAGSRKKRKPGLFAAPYNRPSLKLFNAHCDHVIERYGLADLHVQARAVECAVRDDGVVVTAADGSELSAGRAVLALGASEQPRWPTWAPKDHPRVVHIFDFGGRTGTPEPKESIAVIGGGISAGQVALRLSREGHRVHMVARHPLRENQFDSDPGWLGPKLMTRFNREASHDRRRAIIGKARHRGSVPPDVRRRLRQFILRERIHWYEADIDGIEANIEKVSLRLSTGVELDFDRVLLATGLASDRPGGALVDALVDSASLPCASCGYPIVDRALRWHPRLHVSGPLAELELGPASRNIAGARRAGDSIVGAYSA